MNGALPGCSVLRAIAAAARTWRQRWIGRSELAGMSERDLADLRIPRHLVEWELARWPWQKMHAQWDELETARRGLPAGSHASADCAPGIRPREAVLVLAAAGLTVLLFALTPVTTRVATFQLDGETVGVFRTVGAGVIAIPILLIARLRPPRDRAAWGLLTLSAVGGFVGFPLLFSTGVQRTSACHAALLMASIPLFTGLLGTGAEKQMPAPRWLIGAGIAMAGEAVLVYSAGPATPSTPATPLGDVLVLAACLCVAGSFVAGARVSKKIGALAATFWAVVLANVVLAPLAAPAAGRVMWAELAPPSWAALLHLAVGAGIIGWAAWYWALARGGVARVAVLQFFQPALSLVFAAIILSERLTPPLLLAATAIFAGIAIARSGRDAPVPVTRPLGGER